MKKIAIILPILAVIVVGGYFGVKQFAPEPSAEQSADTAADFCVERGGVVQDYDKGDGTIQEVCFINDGVDGMRCDLQLFYEKECGIEFSTDLIAHINTDADSEVAMLIAAPTGEGVVVFTKIEEGTEYVDKIGIQTQEGEIGIAEINEVGLPETFEFEGTTFVFENYTENTVDITVTSPDGTVETYEESPLNLPDLEARNLLIPTAYAATSYETTPESGATREDNSESGYYPHTAGQFINIATCGAGVVGTFFGGAGAPLLLTCGQTVIRVTTSSTEIGTCKGDIVECITDLLIEGEALNLLIETKEEIIETFLPSGVELKGNIANRITGTPIEAVLLLNDAQNNNQLNTDEVDEKGDYGFHIKDGGIYTLKVINVGYADKIYDLRISSSLITITDQEEGEVLREEIAEDADDIAFTLDVLMEPEGYIRGEVIDAVEAMPLEGITVSLESGGTTYETEEDGYFSVQPLVADEPLMVTLVASSPDACHEETKEVFLSYDLIDKLSDQYQVFADSALTPLDSGFDVIIKMMPPGLMLAGTLVDQGTGEPVSGATMEMEMWFSGTTASVTTGADGRFSFALTEPIEDFEYMDLVEINISKDSYMNQTFSFSLKQDGDEFNLYDSDEAAYACTIKLDPFYGPWEGRATSSIAGIGDEIICGGADISLTVSVYDTVAGLADADLDYRMEIDGTITEDGEVEAGMAYGGENVASFELQLSSDGTGQGTWTDAYGCYGTLSFEKEL